MPGTALVVVGDNAAAKRKVGRPPFEWTQEIEDTLFYGLVEGRTLKELCEEEGMPSYTTVWQRGQDDLEFAKRVAYARMEGAHHMVEEARQIAATPQQGRTVTYGPDGMTMKVEDALGHRRLHIETLLRTAGKINAQYGDKKSLEVTGPGGGAIQHIHAEMTPKEAADAYQQALKALASPDV